MYLSIDICTTNKYVYPLILAGIFNLCAFYFENTNSWLGLQLFTAVHTTKVPSNAIAIPLEGVG